MGIPNSLLLSQDIRASHTFYLEWDGRRERVCSSSCVHPLCIGIEPPGLISCCSGRLITADAIHGSLIGRAAYSIGGKQADGISLSADFQSVSGTRDPWPERKTMPCFLTINSCILYTILVI